MIFPGIISADGSVNCFSRVGSPRHAIVAEVPEISRTNVTEEKNVITKFKIKKSECNNIL